MKVAKYKPKDVRIVDAVQFDAAVPPANFPPGVQENALSPTGFSYGTLADIGTPEIPNRDGFEVNDTDWIITESSGVVYRMNNAELSANWEFV